MVYDESLFTSFLQKEFDSWRTGNELLNARGVKVNLAPATTTDDSAACFVAFIDAYLTALPIVALGHDGGRGCLTLQDGRRLNMVREPSWRDNITPAINVTGFGS